MRGNSSDNCVTWDIFHNYSTCRYNGSVTNCDSFKNHGIATDPIVTFKDNVLIVFRQFLGFSYFTHRPVNNINPMIA